MHHLIDKYNVWTLDGCRDAVDYLDDAYLKVDSHYATLAAWAKSMEDAHAMTASFFASQAWEDFFVHGVAPEGTVDWPGPAPRGRVAVRQCSFNVETRRCIAVAMLTSCANAPAAPPASA